MKDLLTNSTSQCTKLEESVASLQESLDQLTQDHKSTNDELAVTQSQLVGTQKMLQQKEDDIEVWVNFFMQLNKILNQTAKFDKNFIFLVWICVIDATVGTPTKNE